MLLGEWACLGILAEAPAHGFAVAARLKPDGDIAVLNRGYNTEERRWEEEEGNDDW